MGDEPLKDVDMPRVAGAGLLALAGLALLGIGLLVLPNTAEGVTGAALVWAGTTLIAAASVRHRAARAAEKGPTDD